MTRGKFDDYIAVRATVAPLATYGCEERIEALDELITSLERHPPRAVLEAMATHLEALPPAMLAAGECPACDVRDFLRETERGALNWRGEAAKNTRPAVAHARQAPA